MNEMIKLYDLFGTEIRSRSNADVLREKILDCNISTLALYMYKQHLLQMHLLPDHHYQILELLQSS